jgi:hypothetical protein
MDVNGLTLPDGLVRAVERGDWPPPVAADRLAAIFPEGAGWPMFFTLAGIEDINREWATETRVEFVGTPGADGSVRPDRTLLIGQLDQDQLVALDFSDDAASPSVIYLTDETRSGQIDAIWRQVASSIDEFLEMLAAGG